MIAVDANGRNRLIPPDFGTFPPNGGQELTKGATVA
jgi:hypothetical protein